MISDPVKETALNRNRLQIACSIVEGYDGSVPFHHYLSRFFAANKGFGSTDRRLYRSWCYAFFRIGKTLNGYDTLTRMAAANFIAGGHAGFPFASSTLPELTEKFTTSVEERVKIIAGLFPDFSIDDVFPIDSPLSNGIDIPEFTFAFFSQPDVFIRINQGAGYQVETELRNKGIAYSALSDSTLSFTSGVNLQELSAFRNRLFQVQDLSSQTAGTKIPVQKAQRWWDCCCGAGGKSLQMMDRCRDIQLTASDKRESIIEEFKKRLPQDQQKAVSLMVIDIEQDTIPFGEDCFDGILTDVPCTGSGTWRRTPEWLSFFDREQIEIYAARQKAILQKVIPHLRKGGTLAYITCSVFRAENEDVTGWAVSELNLRIQEQSVICRIENNSDSMFYAILEKL